MQDSKEILIARKEQIVASHRNEHPPYEYNKYAVTERRPGTDQIYAAIYELPPQKANYPYHYHMANEELFYIISGTGILVTPEGERQISAGDVIVCPTGEKSAHKIVNISETETLTYLDVDASRSTDVVFYPDSNKVGLNLNGIRNAFYRIDSDVGYYEGE